MADVDLRYMAEGESVEGYVRYLIDELNYILQNLEEENMVDGLLKSDITEVKNLPKKEEEKVFFEGTWATGTKNFTGWDDYSIFLVRVKPGVDADLDIICYRRSKTIRGNTLQRDSAVQYSVQIDVDDDDKASIGYIHRHYNSSVVNCESILRVIGII